MSRKWIGVIVAIVLAAIGTWVLVRYVQGAENRALEGEETVEVLVVDAAIPAGSGASDIGDKVHVELVPVKVQAPGSVASLSDLGDKVAAIDLVAGEQIIMSRFVTVEAFEELKDFVVPDGLLEVTLSLGPARALGGALRPGDQVAVFASFDPFNLDTTIPDTEQEGQEAEPGEGAGVEGGPPASEQQSTKTPNTTHIIIHNIIVTNVQVEELPQENTSEESSSSSLEYAPTGNLLITLAMEPPDAERFVFTAEFGRVWLAETSDTVDEEGTSIQDRSTVYDDPVPVEQP